MRILIVAATQFEIAPLIKQLALSSIQEGKVSLREYKELKIGVLITGVGMVPTAYYIGKNLSGDYDFVINAGICGSFNNNLETGSVVNIVEDCFSELGAEDGDNFLSLNELQLPGCTTVKNSDLSFKNVVLELLPKVNGITVNKVHGNESSIERVVNKFHPIVETMEGGAFMFSCKESGVQYVQIRAVSNYVERRNRDNWNIPLAIKNLNEKIIDVLDAF